jgi:alpha,alpha-trehalase
LQELALASEYNRKTIVLNEERLKENPLMRLSRLIKYHFWDSLTRRMDANGLEKICNDPKNRQLDQKNRIYVPFHDTMALEYYTTISENRPHLRLQVERLPEYITPQYVKSINDAPGILSLALKTYVDLNGETITRGVPFVVPGGRFNEMYGWDSYFEALGLIADGRIELAKSMVENFWYELERTNEFHLDYDKILNANRSYYLTRSQPPFLTDMMIQTYRAFRSKPNYTNDGMRSWIIRGMRAAVKELFGVWLTFPRLDSQTALVKYHPEGLGMPPETEASHFDHILEPFAKSYGLDLETFASKYNSGEIVEPFLEQYFVHDRAVRESGHDTTYRFDNRCAFLATIDLNSLIYKYEKDLADLINEHACGRYFITNEAHPKNKKRLR